MPAKAADPLRWLFLLLLCLVALPTAARATEATSPTIAALVAEARRDATGATCDRLTEDALARVLCRGRIRIGVRTNYAGFGVLTTGASDTAWDGYEIDLARAVAATLGVALDLVSVTPATRIAVLLEGRVDLVIATMGHTSLRDTQARFIRPHYFSSRTVIIGDRRIRVETEDDLAGRTICVPLGNADTTRVAGDGARLLIFDSPQQMLDALRMDICTLAMHDDSFFAPSFRDPHFQLRFEPKLIISTLPWGMATARPDRLALLLDRLAADWHADGTFLAAANRHSLVTAFLDDQRLRWQAPGCLDASGGPIPACLDAPADTTLPPTSFAADVEAFERWFSDTFGVGLALPMLKSQIALDFFLWGIAISLLLVVGSLVATLVFAVGFGAALCARSALWRVPVQLLTGLLQCSPLVLLLFFGYAMVSTVTPYSPRIALGLSIVMIGLYNGSHAGRAIADAHGALRAASPGADASLLLSMRGASVQVMSFLVNATKGSSVASMIGVPELLNALTDITSFTSERIMTYSFLLVFYSALVLLVVWATRILQRRVLR
jgi:ABC-type amino acid transport substrate-binding protein/ABC-type amino acid transport system permease subunit